MSSGCVLGWSIWTAGIVNNTTTRDLFIGSVKKWASSGLSNVPLGDWYDADDGAPEVFRARPVVVGHLVLVRTELQLSDAISNLISFKQLVLYVLAYSIRFHGY